MRITLFGTRGSLAAPGPETTRYGGNTPCVEICEKNGADLVLDAGTGIRRLAGQIPPSTRRIDILLAIFTWTTFKALASSLRSMILTSRFMLGTQ